MNNEQRCLLYSWGFLVCRISWNKTQNTITTLSQYCLDVTQIGGYWFYRTRCDRKIHRSRYSEKQGHNLPISVCLTQCKAMVIHAYSHSPVKGIHSSFVISHPPPPVRNLTGAKSVENHLDINSTSQTTTQCSAWHWAGKQIIRWIAAADSTEISLHPLICCTSSLWIRLYWSGHISSTLFLWEPLFFPHDCRFLLLSLVWGKTACLRCPEVPNQHHFSLLLVRYPKTTTNHNMLAQKIMIFKCFYYPPFAITSSLEATSGRLNFLNKSPRYRRTWPLYWTGSWSYIVESKARIPGAV